LYYADLFGIGQRTYFLVYNFATDSIHDGAVFIFTAGALPKIISRANPYAIAGTHGTIDYLDPQTVSAFVDFWSIDPRPLRESTGAQLALVPFHKNILAKWPSGDRIDGIELPKDPPPTFLNGAQRAYQHGSSIFFTARRPIHLNQAAEPDLLLAYQVSEPRRLRDLCYLYFAGT
jgi:hypothetical protein